MVGDATQRVLRRRHAWICDKFHLAPPAERNIAWVARQRALIVLACRSGLLDTVLREPVPSGCGQRINDGSRVMGKWEAETSRQLDVAA